MASDHKNSLTNSKIPDNFLTFQLKLKTEFLDIH